MPTKGAKHRVLKLKPEAFAHSWADCWVIYSRERWGNQQIGMGKTAAMAWADAAKRHRAHSRSKT